MISVFERWFDICMSRLLLLLIFRVACCNYWSLDEYVPVWGEGITRFEIRIVLVHGRWVAYRFFNLSETLQIRIGLSRDSLDLNLRRWKFWDYYLLIILNTILICNLGFLVSILLNPNDLRLIFWESFWIGHIVLLLRVHVWIISLDSYTRGTLNSFLRFFLNLLFLLFLFRFLS